MVKVDVLGRNKNGTHASLRCDGYYYIMVSW